jgi:hypothetical protein
MMSACDSTVASSTVEGFMVLGLLRHGTVLSSTLLRAKVESEMSSVASERMPSMMRETQTEFIATIKLKGGKIIDQHAEYRFDMETDFE